MALIHLLPFHGFYLSNMTNALPFIEILSEQASQHKMHESDTSEYFKI